MAMVLRCSACLQLMKVARPRAGATIRCPKCHTRLMVPAATAESGPVEASAAPPAAEPSPISVLAEGLRAEPEAAGPSEAEMPEEEPPPALLNLRLGPESEPEPGPEPEPEPEPVFRPAPTPPGPVPPSPESAPIVVPPPTLFPDRPGPARHRDVTLPRTVLIAWSLFALLALALAFVAGLFVGHYVWGARVVR